MDVELRISQGRVVHKHLAEDILHSTTKCNAQERGLYLAGNESNQKVMSMLGCTIYEFP